MLTSKQRAALRGIANRLEPCFVIGKAGVTNETITQLYLLLEARELIKLNVLKTCPLSAKEVSEQVCGRTGAQGVSCLGGKVVIYKESREHHTALFE